jgi:hypothetical protein
VGIDEGGVGVLLSTADGGDDFDLMKWAIGSEIPASLGFLEDIISPLLYTLVTND